MAAVLVDEVFHGHITQLSLSLVNTMYSWFFFVVTLLVEKTSFSYKC